MTDMQRSRAVDGPPGVGLIDVLTWLGQGKRLIAACTASAIAVAVCIAFLLPPIYTARTSLLPPGSQQQSGAAASLAALGSLGGLAGGLGAKTPDELYVALLRSDSVARALAERFSLMQRYKAKNFEALRRDLLHYIRVTSDKKTGMISIEVDDEEPKFAADLANAHATEVTKLMARLAVSEAQQRRAFFELQLKETKENLVKAETSLRRFQEKSGMVVLEKQAEALIGGVAQLRGMIAEREVKLRVLRTGATEQNPDVIRLNSELAALRSEQTRMESSQTGSAERGSPTNMAVSRLPEAAIEYVRARRELKLQETLLEAMVKQFELAKLDEAKEGPLLQQVDVAMPPDAKSRPSRGLIIITMALLGMFIGASWVVFRRYAALGAATQTSGQEGWRSLKRAWKFGA